MNLEPEERREYVYNQLDDYGRLYMSCLELFVQKLWCRQRMLFRNNKIYEEKLATISEVIGALTASDQIVAANKNESERLESTLHKINQIIFIPPLERGGLQLVNELMMKEAADNFTRYNEPQSSSPPPSTTTTATTTSSETQLNSPLSYQPKAGQSGIKGSSSSTTTTNTTNKCPSNNKRKSEADNELINDHQLRFKMGHDFELHTEDEAYVEEQITADSYDIDDDEDDDEEEEIEIVLKSNSLQNFHDAMEPRCASRKLIPQKSSILKRFRRPIVDKEMVKCCIQMGCRYLERQNANHMRKHYRSWHDDIEYPKVPYVKVDMTPDMITEHLEQWMLQRKSRQQRTNLKTNETI